MELEAWQLAKNAALALLKLSSIYDGYYYLAYLALALFRLNSLPILIATLLCSSVYEITYNLPPIIFWVLCSIILSYLTMYYYSIKNRAWLGCAALSFYMFTMGMEVLLNAAFGEQFYNSLYDSYEIVISLLHIFVVVLLIDWRACFKFMAKLFDTARARLIGFN